MHADLHHHAAHRRAHLTAVPAVRLRTALVLDGGLLVVNHHLARLAVHLVKDVALAGGVGQGADGQQLEDEHFPLLQLDVELLVDLRRGQEEARRQHRQVAVPGHEGPVVGEDLGVHGVARHVALGDAPVLLRELRARVREVERLQREAGPFVELAAATQGAAAQRLREPAVRLAHQPLEELEHRLGKVELLGLVDDVLLAQLVGDHELREVADDLGRGRDLDDVAEQVVGLLVGLLGRGPLGAEPQLRGLEDEVGELAPRDLVLVDLRVRAGEPRLEGRVQQAQLRPVGVEGADVVPVVARVVWRVLERGQQRAHRRLRRHARQAVGGRVDGVGARLGAGHVGGDAGAGRVVAVHVDGQVRVLLADAADELRRRVGLEHAGHVLDAEHVDAEAHDLVHQLEVVLEVVLLLGVQHVAAVADGALDDAAGLLHRLDAHLELVDVVERVEDAEHVDAALLGLLAEVLDGVVRQRLVGDAVGAAQQHLEGDVGHGFPQLAQAVPRVLVQEAHGHVEGGAAPALERVGAGVGDGGLLGRVEQVDGAHARRQQRLVRVAPRRVHEKEAFVLAHRLGKGVRPLLVDELLEAPLGRVVRHVDDVAVVVQHGGHDDLALELGLAHLALDAAAVDRDVAEVVQQLLRAVLTRGEVEEARGVVDEGGPAVALEEDRVREQRAQESDVGLDAADAEFDEGAQHLAAHHLVGAGAAGALDQHGVVVGGDDGAGEAVARVEAHAVAAGGAVDLDLARVGPEAVGRVLGGDAALHGEAADGDAVLGQVEVRQRGAGGHLDLRGHDVDARDLLGDGVLDLDARVDLDEVVPVLLVDEELGGPRVAVVDRLGQLDGVGEDGVAHARGQLLGRRQLHHLLVPALHAAVALEQVDDVAVRVAQQLHLDVLGPVEEALDEHGAVAKGRLGLGRGALEGVLEFGLLAHHAHAAPAAAKGGLDDDGEAVLVGELLDLLVPLDGALGAGHHGHVALDGQLAGRDLVAEGVDGVGRGADEDDAGLLHVAGELGVLGQEAVARVDHVHAVLAGDVDDGVAVEVGADGRVLAALADHVGLVGLLAVHAQPVLVAEDGDGVHGELVGGAEDAHGDLAAVGHEQLVVLAHHAAAGSDSAIHGGVRWGEGEADRKVRNAAIEPAEVGIEDGRKLRIVRREIGTPSERLEEDDAPC